MSKRDRYNDVRSAGRSDVAPFVGWQGHQGRHSERMDTALRFRDVMEQWCQAHGLKLTIHNEGHHWKMTNGVLLAEWWPSSAKLVFDKKWANGIHCHDVEQLATLVGKRLGI